MAHVAFIGLGRMGHGMAGRYLDSGFTVAVWNRSKAKADDLAARGARWADSPAEAADGADAVVTMVADDEASRAVWLGKDGAAVTAKAGALAIECSTVSYRHALDLARDLRARGLVYIDSPVTGLPDAAAAGKLTLLVGAEPADLKQARPFLMPLSTMIRHFGPVGSGTVYKLINNLMGAIQIAGLAEGLAIAEQAGLDMNLVLDVIEHGVAASPQVLRHSKRRWRGIFPARPLRPRCGTRMPPMPSHWRRACCPTFRSGAPRCRPTTRQRRMRPTTTRRR
jgi:3-hydroxyisobutyrate dehydrogenase-like beta-hydroxyacid dehydrogenase